MLYNIIILAADNGIPWGSCDNEYIVIPYKTTSVAVCSPLLAPRAAVESRGWGSTTWSLDYDHSGTTLRVEGGTPPLGHWIMITVV